MYTENDKPKGVAYSRQYSVVSDAIYSYSVIIYCMCYNNYYSYKQNVFSYYAIFYNNRY